MAERSCGSAQRVVTGDSAAVGIAAQGRPLLMTARLYMAAAAGKAAARGEIAGIRHAAGNHRQLRDAFDAYARYRGQQPRRIGMARGRKKLLRPACFPLA